MTITEPGIYDMPDAEYHADPVPGGSLSNTEARRLLNCPEAPMPRTWSPGDPPILPPADGEKWTDEHFRVTADAVRILRKAIHTLDDFLTPEEHAELSDGLAEMVRLRRRALEKSAPEVMP